MPKPKPTQVGDCCLNMIEAHVHTQQVLHAFGTGWSFDLPSRGALRELLASASLDATALVPVRKRFSPPQVAAGAEADAEADAEAGTASRGSVESAAQEEGREGREERWAGAAAKQLRVMLLSVAAWPHPARRWVARTARGAGAGGDGGVAAVVAAVVEDPQDHQGLREATAAQKALLVSAVLREAGFEEAMRAQLEALPRWRWRLLDALQLGGDAALVRSFPPARLSGALRWLAALVQRASSHHDEGRAAMSAKAVSCTQCHTSEYVLFLATPHAHSAAGAAERISSCA